MSRKRPINADVPTPEPEEKPEPRAEPAKAKAEPTPKPVPTPDAEKAKPAAPGGEPKPAEPPEEATAKPVAAQPKTERSKPTPPPAPASKPRRRGIPGALKLVGGLVAAAVLLIVIVIVAGSGGPGEEEAPETIAPAPAPSTPDPAPEAPPAEAAAELGFPAFATGNTTRVGGSDPAANAAAVALAVFPSTKPVQRPAAVTLVGEDDAAGGIAASVLMAAPVRAPVLIAGAEELPEPTEEALEALAPQGSTATGGTMVFAVGDVAVPDDVTLRRVNPTAAGGARSAEAEASQAAAIAALRDRLFGGPPEHVVVAPLSDPAFAMPAAGWAARSGDPVLFAEPERLPKATAAAIERHPKVPVFVLGPSSAISSDVVREIAALGPEVKRVSGEDPVTNAIALARYSSGGFGWNVNDPGHGFVVTRETEPLNAAAAAPLSASGTWGPLLLSDDAATLPAELRDYFLDVKPGYTDNPTRAFYNHVWLVGDLEAIDVNQQAEVNELAELARIGSGE